MLDSPFSWKAKILGLESHSLFQLSFPHVAWSWWLLMHIVANGLWRTKQKSRSVSALSSIWLNRIRLGPWSIVSLLWVARVNKKCLLTTIFIDCQKTVIDYYMYMKNLFALTKVVGTIWKLGQSVYV